MENSLKKFWILTAVYIIGIALCIILPGWYKLFSAPFITGYILFRLRLLNDEIKATETTIKDRVWKE